MSKRIRARRDSKQAWESINPELAAGEFGVQLADVNNPHVRFKVGPGLWNDLPYAETDSVALAVVEYMSDHPAEFQTSPVLITEGADEGLYQFVNHNDEPVGEPVEFPAGPPGPFGSALRYRGLWNPDNNVPILIDGVGTAGDCWLCSVDGEANLGSGNLVFDAGDYAIYTGTTWQRVSAALVSAPGSFIVHGSNANYPRAAGAVFQGWVGDVEPTLALDNDIWFDISGDPPDIVTTSLPSMNVGVPYTTTIVCLGTVPITYTLVSGSIPAGLTLASDGQLSGTPSTSGAYSFTLRATNGYGTNDQPYSGTVGAAIAPTITTTSLPAMNAGAPITPVTLAATGSVPITWAVTSGTLPTGLSLNTSTGVLTGTPASSGAYSFTVTATNSSGSDGQAYSGTIGAAISPVVLTTSFGDLEVGVPFSLTLSASGSTPITWSVTSGALPGGLALNTSTGAVTGTPTTNGAYSVIITATNGSGSDNQVFTGTVIEVNISFTAAGSGQSAAGSSLSFVGPDANEDDTVIVWLAYGRFGAPSSVAVTYGGSPMTKVGTSYIWLDSISDVWVECWKMEGVGDGTATIAVTVTGGSAYGLRANGVAYSNVASVGSVVNNAGVSSAPAHTVSSADGRVISQVFMINKADISSYNRTSRWSNSAADWLGSFAAMSMLIGDSAGAASVGFSAASSGSASWGSAAVELLRA